MEILIVLVFGLATAMVLWYLRPLSLVTGCVLVIIAGVTIGHPFWHLETGFIPLTIDRLLWCGLVALFALLVWYRRIEFRQLNRTDLLVILLGLVLVVSTLLHDWRFRNGLPISRLIFFNLMPMGFYFIAKHCRIENRQLIVIYGLLAVFGFFLGLVGIAEQRGWSALVYPRFILDPANLEFLGRARGPFLNPVSLGIYLTVCLVAACGLWKYCHPLLRVGLAILAGTMLVACFLTYTRSVWVGCAIAAGLACWLYARPPLRGAMVVAGTVLLLVTMIGFAGQFNRFQRDKYVSRAEMAESVSLRPMLAQVAWKMFRDKPLFGHGFGQYTAVKKPYHYSETADLPLQKVLPYMQHNVFLSYLTETGLIGLVLLLSLLISATIKGWRLWDSRSRPWAQRWFGVIVLSMSVAYVVNGMFHDVSIIAHVAILWFLLLGVLENLSDRKRSAAVDAGDAPNQHWLDAGVAA